MTYKGVRVNGAHERAGFVNGVGSRLVLLQACHRESSVAELQMYTARRTNHEPVWEISRDILGSLVFPTFPFPLFCWSIPDPTPTSQLRRGSPEPAPSVAADPTLLRAQHNRKPFLSRLPSPARVLELRNLTFSINQYTRVALTQHLSQWLFPLSLISPSRPTT